MHFIVLICVYLIALAGQGMALILSGEVTIEGTPLPIAKASVSVGENRVFSDSRGRFYLELEPGNYQLIVSANGYVAEQIDLEMSVDSQVDVALDFATVIQAPNQTVVAARQQEELAFYSVDNDIVQRLTEASLFADTFNALKMLPGVGSKGTFDAALHIRGGSAYEMVGVLDNVPIYEPYFFGGRLSLFNSKIVETLDFYPGGYEARGGQSLSGIMDIYTKDGSFTEHSTDLEANLTELNVYRGGPLKKDRTAYMLSYRRTYYDLFAPLFLTSDSGKVNMPYLQSFQSKITHKLSDKHTLKWGMYWFDDGADTPLDAVGAGDAGEAFKYDQSRVIASLGLSSQLTKTLLNTVTVASFTNGGFYTETTDYDVRAEWSQQNAIFRNDLHWDLNDSHDILAGSIMYLSTNDSTASWVLPPSPYQENTSTVNVSLDVEGDWLIMSHYIQDHWKLSEKTELRSGLRFDGTKVLDYAWNTEFQPRFSLLHRYSDKTVFKGYYGIYKQQAIDENQIYTGENELARSLADTEMESAVHYGVGVQYDKSEKSRFKTELFYKDYSDLTVDTGDGAQEIYENEGEGYAYGLELMLQKIGESEPNGWITYTFSQTKRKDLDGWYSPDYDLTHMFNGYLELPLSRNRTWVTTVKVSSGFLYTPILYKDIDSNTGSQIYVKGGRYSKRSAPYVRLDTWLEWPGVKWLCPIPFLPISEKKLWGIFPYFEFNGSTRLGVYNVLNVKSPTSYYWDNDSDQGDFVYDFPVMAIYGIQVTF